MRNHDAITPKFVKMSRARAGDLVDVPKLRLQRAQVTAIAADGSLSVTGGIFKTVVSARSCAHAVCFLVSEPAVQRRCGEFMW